MARRRKYFEQHIQRFPEAFRLSLAAKIDFKDTLEADERLEIPARIWLAFLTPPEGAAAAYLEGSTREIWRLKKDMLESFEHPGKFLEKRDPFDRSSECITLAVLEMLYDLREAKVLLPQERYRKWAEIAEHFGLWRLRYALEDATFKSFAPETFSLFEGVLERQAFVDAHIVEGIRAILSAALRKNKLRDFTIANRKKNIWGIYDKLRLKKKNLNEIFDIHGFRVLTDTPEECYRAVDVLHCLWPHFPERYKDYIASPKQNGYQSIHTVLSCLEKKPVEFQVRTREMDAVAASGPANHEGYKKGQKVLP